MTDLLDVIDELNRGRNFVKAAYMAAHGCGSFDSEEQNALACILGEAEDRLEAVKTRLEEINKAAPKD